MSQASAPATTHQATAPATDYDPFGEQVLADPYPYYRTLRRETPVSYATGSGIYCVARYAEAQAVLRDSKTFSADATRTVTTGAAPTVDLISKLRLVAQLIPLALRHPRTARVMASRNMLGLDPPDHTKMRNIVNRAFTPRAVASWEPRIREISDDLGSQLRQKSAFDLMENFAVPLPVSVIIEMLGVDLVHRHEFKHWSDRLIAGLFGPKRNLGLSKSGAFEAMCWLSGHMRQVVRDRQREPRDDVISVLVRAQDEEGALTEAETLFFAVGLLVAGNETTTRLIGSMVHALLQHPDQLDLVRRDPSLIPAVVEESLRLEGPAQLTLRRATKETALAGVRIPRNAMIAVLLASANRDETHWGENAERFDVTRDARGHLGFSLGAHFCLGAGLARLEGRIAMETLLEDLPSLKLERPAKIAPSFIARGIEQLALIREAP
jgi:cytochrome P450